MTTDETMQKLRRLIVDFETGYIANHSVAADRKRAKHEAFLRELLADIEKASKSPSLARNSSARGALGELARNA